MSKRLYRLGRISRSKQVGYYQAELIGPHPGADGKLLRRGTEEQCLQYWRKLIRNLNKSLAPGQRTKAVLWRESGD